MAFVTKGAFNVDRNRIASQIDSVSSSVSVNNLFNIILKDVVTFTKISTASVLFFYFNLVHHDC